MTMSACIIVHTRWVNEHQENQGARGLCYCTLSFPCVDCTLETDRCDLNCTATLGAGSRQPERTAHLSSEPNRRWASVHLQCDGWRLHDERSTNGNVATACPEAHIVVVQRVLTACAERATP
jgi:hypothetical protein